MSAPTKTSWYMTGEEPVTCNCAWGCSSRCDSPPFEALEGGDRLFKQCDATVRQQPLPRRAVFCAETLPQFSAIPINISP